MKILPVGAELFHADRRTDMKLLVAFSNFEKASENCFFANVAHITNNKSG
jgi:putative ribosome biogenesis GTPase RsgA